MKKESWFNRVRAWIAVRVKGIVEWMWRRGGWKLFAVLICALGITLVVLVLVVRYRV